MTPSDPFPAPDVMEEAVSRARRFDVAAALDEDGGGKMRDVMEILGAAHMDRVRLVAPPPFPPPMSEEAVDAARKVLDNQRMTLPEPDAQGLIDLSPEAALARAKDVINNTGSRRVSDLVNLPDDQKKNKS